MIPILSSDSYRGFSTNLLLSSHTGAQPVFVGRLIWPQTTEVADAVIKLYEIDSCGLANEVIGYTLNHLRHISQPKSAAIMLLSAENLMGLDVDFKKYIDPASGMIACWATSLEQNTKPFRFVRQLASFSEKQMKAFCKSQFCKRLASADHITGNNDRHDGNFLYIDDLKYIAIDQGCVGGGPRWHLTWPDTTARNELIALTRNGLSSTELSTWIGEAIIEHAKAQESWRAHLTQIKDGLVDLLDDDSTAAIVQYMDDRAVGSTFSVSCGRLI